MRAVQRSARVVGVRRFLALLALIALLNVPAPGARAKILDTSPVIFVHGMGGNAADVGTTQFGDLLVAVARAHPTPDICQRDAQPDRPWTGSPCVFRFVEDMAERDRGPNDSQSAVRDNAGKLADEIEEVASNTQRRVILVGYSMGGAIIRTYLALHRADADERVEAVVLIDGVASGSWGYAFAGAVPRRASGKLGDRLSEVMRSMAASSAAVNFDRPATRDLSPRSELFRTIAPMPLPQDVDYYTFWGDIRISVERSLLAYELPAYDMPSVGDLGLLPGSRDPTELPELGGQRFSPPVDGAHEALDVPHRTRIRLDAQVIGDLISQCGRPPTKDGPSEGGRACRALAAEHFRIPNTHTAIPTSMAKVTVSDERLGGRVSLLDAVLEAIRRNA
jgi:pimeloyl-ACP methyl ester carboxylesterase